MTHSDLAEQAHLCLIRGELREALGLLRKAYREYLRKPDIEEDTDGNFYAGQIAVLEILYSGKLPEVTDVTSVARAVMEPPEPVEPSLN